MTATGAPYEEEGAALSFPITFPWKGEDVPKQNRRGKKKKKRETWATLKDKKVKQKTQSSKRWSNIKVSGVQKTP